MFSRFFEDESGQSMVEYALIVALVAVVIVAVVRIFGSQIRDLFTRSTDKIQSETADSFGG